MREIKFFKSVNDFIIGLALLALGVYVLVTDDIITGSVVTGDGGALVRPDVYVRLIGGLLTFFAALLTLKSVNWTGKHSGSKIEFAVTREVIFTLASLVVYTLLLELTAVVKYQTGLRDGIGFFIATFLLIAALTLVFRRKEKQGGGESASGDAGALSGVENAGGESASGNAVSASGAGAESGERGKGTRPFSVREAAIVLVYAAALDIVVWAVFSKVLHVSLP